MPVIHLSRVLTRARDSLWLRPAIYAVIAVAALILAPTIAPILPDQLVRLIGLDGVYDLLSALANSLLAVAIFSLGILASSMQVAASAATPRARPLLMKDRTAQNAISTFIGGFIFAIVGIVGLSTSYYNDASRVVLFFAACVVIAAVILALIRWIGRLSSLGDVSEVIDRLEEATSAALSTQARDPFLGGTPASPPEDGIDLFPDGFGYLQAIDMTEIARIAETTALFLLGRPGAYLDPARPLLCTRRPLDEDSAARLRAAFVLGPDRQFEGDPRFGLVVLSEVASRALSPGINDPGTAISVIGTSVGLLAGWAEALAPDPEVRHPNLHVVPLAASDLLEDAFRWIARDGAAQLEVQIRLQKGLATLAAHDPALFGPAARALSQESLDRAALAMPLPADLARLRREAGRLWSEA